MAAPPDQSKYDLLDLEPYHQELKPFDFPPLPRAQPRPSAITGLPPGQGTKHRDTLTGLTLGDQFRLLAENNIDLLARIDKEGQKAGVMKAVVVDATLAPSARYSVRFTELKVQPHGLSDRFDTVSHSYSEFESNMQRQLVAAAK